MERVERSIELGVEPERIWPFLAQTDRLNREVGLPPPEFSFAPKPGGGTRATATAKLGPITFIYDEHPFEWSRPHWYRVRRTFRGGPMREVCGGIELQSTPDGCRLTSFGEFDAPVPTRPLVRMKLLRSIEDVLQAAMRAQRHALDASEPAYPCTRAQIVVREDRLSRSIQEIATMPFADALARWVREATDSEASEFRPAQFAEFARATGDVTPTLLAATRAGILDLEWRVMCPYCRSNRRKVSNLREIGADAHCDACAITFDSRFDENVEVLFSVSARIRPVTRHTFCIGGPELTPHVVAQFIVPPGGSREWAAPADALALRISSLQTNARPLISILPDGPSRTRAQIHDAHDLTLSPSGVIELVNDSENEAVVRIEDANWRTLATTAAEVTTLPHFRDQFSSQVLAPGHEMAVRRLCVLFTDLKGSTQMYRDLGDAHSYAAVREHFKALQTAIESTGGSIVKTIGDAVMAVFSSVDAAVEASLAFHAEDHGGLVTKIGLHAGPAIVVNANERLDYFGRTVNLAARLQKFSEGGDVVLTDESFRHLAIGPMSADVESFEASIAGVGDHVALVRIRPHRPK